MKKSCKYKSYKDKYKKLNKKLNKKTFKKGGANYGFRNFNHIKKMIANNPQFNTIWETTRLSKIPEIIKARANIEAVKDPSKLSDAFQ